MTGAGSASRRERDALGTLDVPAEALWGIQTARAVRNFPISGLRPHPVFVDAVVHVKRAAARVHSATGRLDARRAEAIVAAADEVLAGEWRDQFVVDPYQAGAGTSHHMNVNEVLANLANERLGGTRGTYDPVHPNDHVNMAQSTNDVIPTAIRLALLLGMPALQRALADVADAFTERGDAYDDVVKAGRTHLQDAMPIRLGQELRAYAATLRRHGRRLSASADWLRDLGIGGSAVGTGVNVEPTYPGRMVTELATALGMRLREGEDRVQLMQSLGDVAAHSATLRVLALDVGKIASDLRLLASGPRTGLAELALPEVQPGSSIMPGKVNPSIPEMVNQVCLQVLGNDACVAAAAERGELELNVMMPVIAHNVIGAQSLLTNALEVFASRCVRGIEANRAMCAHWLERSAALVTALAPRIGYAAAAELAKRSVAEGVLVRELVADEGLLSADELARVLDLRRLTEPGVPGAS